MKRYAIIHTIICIIAASLIVAAMANAYMAPTPREELTPQGLPHETLTVEGYDAEVCFPRESWDANIEDLPCDILNEPQEDGSGMLILGTLGSDAAECLIPNPYEERGQFVIHCHRVPNR
jgi:hypothetical protein